MVMSGRAFSWWLRVVRLVVAPFCVLCVSHVAFAQSEPTPPTKPTQDQQECFMYEDGGEVCWDPATQSMPPDPALAGNGSSSGGGSGDSSSSSPSASSPSIDDSGLVSLVGEVVTVVEDIGGAVLVLGALVMAFRLVRRFVGS